MNYFAYGSNMSTARLRARVPSATPQGVARLVGYRLAWHKVSKDRSGKCDIVMASPDESVYGVLFRIDPKEKAHLDRAEGRGFGYEITPINVLMDACQKTYTVFTYFATRTNPALKPYSWYKVHVLTGAKEHGLPEPYIRMIEIVEAIEDPDRERDRKERQQSSSI